MMGRLRVWIGSFLEWKLLLRATPALALKIWLLLYIWEHPLALLFRCAPAMAIHPAPLWPFRSYHIPPMKPNQIRYKSNQIFEEPRRRPWEERRRRLVQFLHQDPPSWGAHHGMAIETGHLPPLERSHGMGRGRCEASECHHTIMTEEEKRRSGPAPGGKGTEEEATRHNRRVTIGFLSCSYLEDAFRPK